MNRFLKILILIGFAVAAFGCNKPKNIPDDKLEAIVHDIFVANAYFDARYTTLEPDSIDLYMPIFEKYGYKPADMVYTIENLSKRKSVRFTDIIENVTARLQAEQNIYESQLNRIDSIDNYIAKRYKKELYRNDTTRRFRTPSNPDKADITIPVKKGRYVVEFTYYVDTTDSNQFLQYRHLLRDSADKKSQYTYRSYHKGERTHEKIEFTISDSIVKNLDIALVISPIRNDNRPKAKTNITIDSLVITYVLPINEGRKAFMDEITEKLIPDSLFNTQRYVKSDQKIIVPLRPDTSGTTQARDSIVR